LDERDVGLHEATVPAGEVVDHDRVEPDALERTYDVRADVARSTRDKPRHENLLKGEQELDRERADQGSNVLLGPRRSNSGRLDGTGS
jgi:hypothetical protein